MSLNKSQALSIAKEYMLQRNVRAAIAIYREIIEADPTDLTAINTLGDLYASTGLLQDAITQFSRVADSHIESGFTRKAIATLKKIIAADPTNTETAIKLADMYARAGLRSEARQHYLQIAGDYTRRGETLEALRIFTKIVDLDPSNPSTRIKLGELCLSAGMNEQAYEAFVTAAEQLTNKGEIRRALNAYNEALSIRPDSAGTLAAVYKLSTMLGADPDKVMRGRVSQSAASGNLADENPSTLTPSDQLPAPTAFPHRPESSDDLFVVQETSKAERLVAYGQVNQAIALLKAVLMQKPDNIDLHIKLKDICLRTGMMAEAAQECNELARIHQARGEHDRASDYAVRANRLIQLIEKPSGDLRQPEQKPVEDAEPRFNAASIKLAPPPELKPKTLQITSELDVDRAQPARITLSVVPPAVISTEEAIAADPPPALHPDDAEPAPSVSEATLESDLVLESAIDQTTSSSTDAIASVLPGLSSGTLPVERSRGRLKASAIAATVLAVGLAGTVIGGFAYNSHLDKQYEALALAAPTLVEPSSLPAPVLESQPIEENEPIIVEVTPSLETETSPRLPKPEAIIKNEQPAPPQPVSEPLKIISRPSPTPPRIAANPDSQAYTENRIPAGLAGDVPVTPTHPVEPPPKAVRRSTGVVSGVAVKKVDPVYPKAAREAQQTGVVAVEITINEQGNVSSARALSGPDLLRNAAVLAARAWKFKPSLLGGVPVTTTSTITFNFKL